MDYNGFVIIKADAKRTPADFKCRKPEFAEYLYIESIYDRQERMGRMYWAIHDDKIVGYMMLAMGHVSKDQQADLGIDSYGHMPSLVIARLATDIRYERLGVGRHMVSFAISLATRMAAEVGCRVVFANSDPDAVGFYEKMGFVKFVSRPPLHNTDPCSNPYTQRDSKADEGDILVPMYVDMNQDLSATRELVNENADG